MNYQQLRSRLKLGDELGFGSTRVETEELRSLLADFDALHEALYEAIEYPNEKPLMRSAAALLDRLGPPKKYQESC